MASQSKKIEYIPADKLRFDPQNPRLPSTLDGHDQEAVLGWMLKNGNIIELMGSIGEHGYFDGEPSLAIESPDIKGFYDVIEGNRRLASIKLLHNPELATIHQKAVKAVSDGAKEKPDFVPCVIFQKRDEIEDFLGYRHITGIKPWSSLAKAKYLDALRKTHPGITFEELAKSIGSRADYVARLLAGLAVYEEIRENGYFAIKGLNEESINFAVLTTALNYSSIAGFLGLESGRDLSLNNLDKKGLKELTEWLFEKNDQGKTRVGESRNLKKLSAVVESPPALKAFRAKKPLEDAYTLTDAPTDIFRNVLLDARDKLQTAQSQMYQVNRPSQADADILKDIQTIARDLRTLITQRLLEEEDI